MCKCTPNIRTPFCGKPGCEWPEQLSSNSAVYEVQEGMDRDLNKQFRVTDTRTDSRVATCYVQSNADLVCAALNAYTADEPEARHTLDCDMVKHPNCTRCNCGSTSGGAGEHGALDTRSALTPPHSLPAEPPAESPLERRIAMIECFNNEPKPKLELLFNSVEDMRAAFDFIRATVTKDDGLWNPFGNDGMRHMENADVIGGATDETSPVPVTTWKPAANGLCEHCGLSWFLHIVEDEQGCKDVCTSLAALGKTGDQQ